MLYDCFTPNSFLSAFSITTITMATYVSGYINDLSAVKDNIKLRVRIVRCWMQDLYGKQGIKNMELVIMDEQVSIIFWELNVTTACQLLLIICLLYSFCFRALRCKRLCVWH